MNKPWAEEKSQNNFQIWTYSSLEILSSIQYLCKWYYRFYLTWIPYFFPFLVGPYNQSFIRGITRINLQWITIKYHRIE